MTNNSAQRMAVRTFTLLCVLLLAACDGGIFGTGGADSAEADLGAQPISGAISPDNESSTDAANTTDGNTGGNPGDSSDAGAAPGSEPGNPQSDAGAIAPGVGSEPDTGNGTDGTTGSDAETSTVGATDGADGFSTAGTTDAGNDTGGDDGGADQTNTDAGAGAPMPAESVSVTDDGNFVNDTPTLSGTSAQVFLVNTTNLTLNIIEPITDSASTLFEPAGVSPNSVSATATLGSNATNLAIVDNNSPAEVLISYTEFNAAPSTLSTLVVREDQTRISAVALVSETQTTDPGLSKVRIIQAGTLGDASVVAQVRLQSAGDNPGGVDTSFGPLSFDSPGSEYIELFAGDYELVDSANRIEPFAVTLSGGTVYTLLLTGNGMNSVLIVDDANATLLNP